MAPAASRSSPPAPPAANAEFYCANQLPFVMGTTGGDREALARDVAAAGVYAVIAPNMGKQIVAFQSMMETMADRFPGCFAGYTLSVVESHQRTKADTSGTAKAVVASFRRMGLEFDEERIERVRSEGEQVGRMGVPERHIGGHAFHTYTVTSGDGSGAVRGERRRLGPTALGSPRPPHAAPKHDPLPGPRPAAVTLEFKHNVCGREVYAEGTVDAALFLGRQIAAGAAQKLYSMVDVLGAGAMR